MAVKPTVAIASEFLDAFARIPRSEQRKVRDFTEKFRTDPTSSAINYEKIHGMRDSKVRTVRIGRDYRAIILHPEEGNVYVLAWVDHHDESMAWAKDRLFEINAFTGALQIINVKEVEKVTEAPHRKKTSTPGLLDAVSDDLLHSFGLPDILLPAVRALKSPDRLLELSKHLPAEASEAILWLSEGIPPDEVRELVAAEHHEKKSVDTHNFEKALEHPDSKRRFVTIKSEDDLDAMLKEPLAKWRVFLHPTQERLVRRTFKGPARVLGGAGTGKTVVAMHRAKYLAESVFTDPTDRVLFTTFTANLAEDVRENLSTLLGHNPDRIEVVHLHAWAIRFMRNQGFEFDIASDSDIEEYWKDAVSASGIDDWEVDFLRAEWEQVVQSHGIEKKSEYMTVSRIGRGGTLARTDRVKIWKVFEAYRECLRSHEKQEWFDIIRETRRLLEKKHAILPYRAVVVDEAQDLHDEEWRLIRRIVSEGENDIFLVGDAHQRIFGKKVVLSQCGINIRGRSSKLRINYRTTEQIRNWAIAMLHGVSVDDLDGGTDDEKGYRSLLTGPEPDVEHFESLKEEQLFLRERIQELVTQGRTPDTICLVARTASILRDHYEPVFKGLAIEHVTLGKRRIGPDQSGVRLANMHRVKGLEFPVMILVGMNDGVLPLRLRKGGLDAAARSEHEAKERALVFVSATRARDLLIVTSSGKRSPFLNLSTSSSDSPR